ncbi:MAG: hypothetical protein ACUVQ6_08850 [Dissulfurimicrobium sp.]|uniref:hypothetical protein n=1 Tax=Dissulfurimicrobium sp. TaxID=2022436 RepID=UPI00404B91EB
MDNKGIDPININPILLMQQIKSERKEPRNIKPVQESSKGTFHAPMDRRPDYNKFHVDIMRETGSRLIANILPKDLQSAKKYKIKWRINEENGELILEISDRESGDIVKILTQKEIEKKLAEGGGNGVESFRYLVNKTA